MIAAASERGAEAEAQRGERARVGGDAPEFRPAERAPVPDDQAGERDQDDQAEIGQREAERQPEARDDARLPECARSVLDAIGASVPQLRRLVDLVEDAAVAEVLRLRLGPAAEQRIVDRDQLQRRESASRSSGSAAVGLGRPVDSCLAMIFWPSSL